MKYLITFEKGEACRWLGHLDILRTFERAIRRADLPIAFSSGFNPRERIAFASALSVGVTASNEPAVLEFVASVEPTFLINRLNHNLPPGIQLQSALEIDDAGFRDVLNSYNVAEIEVSCTVAELPTIEAAQAVANTLLERSNIAVEREKEGKKKFVDIRPLIRDIQVLRTDNGRIVFRLHLTLGTEGTAKPNEIIAVLSESIPGLAVRRVHRNRLLKAEMTPIL